MPAGVPPAPLSTHSCTWLRGPALGLKAQRLVETVLKLRAERTHARIDLERTSAAPTTRCDVRDQVVAELESKESTDALHRGRWTRELVLVRGQQHVVAAVESEVEEKAVSNPPEQSRGRFRGQGRVVEAADRFEGRSGDPLRLPHPGGVAGRDIGKHEQIVAPELGEGRPGTSVDVAVGPDRPARRGSVQ